jgi:hypothetical protein
MPDRLYLLDRGGRVAYKGGRGPMGFKPGELEQSIVMLLLDQDGARRPQSKPSTGSEAVKRDDGGAPSRRSDRAK